MKQRLCLVLAIISSAYECQAMEDPAATANVVSEAVTVAESTGQRLCIACREPIAHAAEKCPHCAEYQGGIWRFFSNGSVVLSIFATAASLLALVWSAWGGIRPADSDLTARVMNVLIDLEGKPRSKLGRFDIGPPADDLPLVWASVAVTNTGERDGLLEDLGGVNRQVWDDATGGEAVFPVVIPAGKTRLFYANVGFAPYVTSARIPDDELRAQIRLALSDPIIDGPTFAIYPTPVTLVNHRGSRETLELPIPEDLIVSEITTAWKHIVDVPSQSSILQDGHIVDAPPPRP